MIVEYMPNAELRVHEISLVNAYDESHCTIMLSHLLNNGKILKLLVCLFGASATDSFCLNTVTYLISCQLSEY